MENKLKILAVDDDYLALTEMQYKLASLGFKEVYSAMDAIDAIKKAKDLRPDLVLLDIRMPGEMDGIDAARIIKSLYSIPVVFVTAIFDGPVAERAISAGALAYILKPVNQDTLATTIHLAKYNWDLRTTEWDQLQISIDSEHCITFLNAKSECVFGEKSSLIGKSILDFLPEDTKLQVALVLQDTDKAVREISVESPTLGRRIFRFLVTKISWKNTVIGYTFSGEDVTDELEQQAEFLKEQRFHMLGTMATHLVHDLNNALAPISMGCGILAEMGLVSEKRNILNFMVASADHCRSILKQMVAFATGTASSSSVLEMGPLLSETMNLVKSLFPKDITIGLSIDCEFQIFASPDEIRQAIINLCINARDAMEGEGHLHVSLDKGLPANFHNLDVNREYCMIRVRDSGPGVPLDLQEKIFEPFFSTKGDKGTGLGLASVSRIMDNIGGAVRLELPKSGGSEFQLYIPVVKEALTVLNESNEVTASAGSSETILIADDTGAVLQLTGEMLQIYGYHPLLARNGIDALNLFREHSEEIALVVLDMKMPFMSGTEVAAAIKASHPSMKVIMCSASNLGITSEDMKFIDYFLNKPFIVPEFIKMIQSALRK